MFDQPTVGAQDIWFKISRGTLFNKHKLNHREYATNIGDLKNNNFTHKLGLSIK